MAKDLTAALHALTEQANGHTTRVDKSLPAAKVAPLIPERVGTSGPITSGTGGGIASPLTETAFVDREFYESGWKTTDGLFTLPAIKKLVMKDALKNEVVLNFKEPPA